MTRSWRMYRRDECPPSEVHAMRYEIRIQGHLAPRRLQHFDVEVNYQQAYGETVIVGCLQDQATLFGLLSWLQKLGATLLLVKRLEAMPEKLSGQAPE